MDVLGDKVRTGLAVCLSFMVALMAMTSLATSAAAQDDARDGAIYGVVVDAVGGDPVPDATVALDGEDVHTVRVTGQDGTFSFEGLVAGAEVTITVTREAFEPFSDTVTVDSEATGGTVIQLAINPIGQSPNPPTLPDEDETPSAPDESDGGTDNGASPSLPNTGSGVRSAESGMWIAAAAASAMLGTGAVGLRVRRS